MGPEEDLSGTAADGHSGKSAHNRYDHFTTPTPCELRLTRRHHPLLGQRLELLQGGRRELLVRTETGAIMRIPRAWTDADGTLANPEHTASVFTVESIRQLSELLRALRRPKDEKPGSR